MRYSSPNGADWKSATHEPQQPLQRRPGAVRGRAAQVVPSQAEDLARDHYGLAVRASILSSERDQNFLLRGADGRAYVLKATHPAEDPAVTDFHTQAQLRLMRAGGQPPVPHLLPRLAGDYVHWHDDASGARRAIRLMTFVDGVPLHQVARTPAQHRRWAARWPSLTWRWRTSTMPWPATN